MSQDPWKDVEKRAPLLAKLADPAVATTADVLAYLEAQDRSDMLPAQFFTDADLDHYRAACAWWPEHDDMPLRWRKPSLTLLCDGYADPWTDGTVHTFLGRLNVIAGHAAAWMKEHGPKPLGRPRVHPTLPGESEADRAARLNRERVARHRGTTSPRVDPARAALIKEVAQELKVARLHRQEALEGWDIKIAQLKTKLLTLKTEAKDVQ